MTNEPQRNGRLRGRLGKNLKAGKLREGKIAHGIYMALTRLRSTVLMIIGCRSAKCYAFVMS